MIPNSLPNRSSSGPPRTASLPIEVTSVGHTFTSPIPIQNTGIRPGTPLTASSKASPKPASGILSKSPSPATSPSTASLASSRRTVPVSSSLAISTPPSPGVYLHMQRRAILRKMTSLILSYHRKQEFGLNVPFIMIREYPRAVNMSRSLLSHLNALEAAGALKRCNPRCECGADECLDEAGSVQGITLIMKVLGFMDDRNQGIGGQAPKSHHQQLSSSIDSGVDVGEAFSRTTVLPMGNYGGEVSDFSLIDEMAGEGRIRMGRFQTHWLERKKLGERYLRQRMELVKASQSGFNANTLPRQIPPSWKKEWKKMRGIAPKNYDLLKLRPILPSGLSPLAEVWIPEEEIFLESQLPLRHMSLITIVWEGDSRRQFQLDLDELEHLSAAGVSVHSLICKRAESIFETSINKLKVKRTSSILQLAKSSTADDETEFRDGDVITAQFAKLNKVMSSSSFNMLSKSKSLSNITKAMSNFGVGSPPSSPSSYGSSPGYGSPTGVVGLSQSPRGGSAPSPITVSPRTPPQVWPQSSSQPRPVPVPTNSPVVQPPKKSSKSKPVSLLRQLLNQ